MNATISQPAVTNKERNLTVNMSGYPHDAGRPWDTQWSSNRQSYTSAGQSVSALPEATSLMPADGNPTPGLCSLKPTCSPASEKCRGSTNDHVYVSTRASAWHNSNRDHTSPSLNPIGQVGQPIPPSMQSAKGLETAKFAQPQHWPQEGSARRVTNECSKMPVWGQLIPQVSGVPQDAVLNEIVHERQHVVSRQQFNETTLTATSNSSTIGAEQLSKLNPKKNSCHQNKLQTNALHESPPNGEKLRLSREMRDGEAFPVATVAAEKKMAAYLVCLTAGGGVPLFTRKTTHFKALPFPLIGSLNGVHMFVKSHEANLLNASTKDAKIIWKEFYDSVTLIIMSSNDQASDSHLYHILDTIFNTMVFYVGLDDIVNLKNVERLKRDLRSCFTVVDSLLTQLVDPSIDLPLVGDLVLAVDCLLCPETVALQSNLDSFVECVVNSTYGCLLTHNRIVAATKSWWMLNVKDLALLSFYLAASPKTTCRDVPIYLPVGSPKVPHRLLVFQLVQGVEVCLLCGPTPTLTQLEKQVGRFWKNSYELLKSTLNYLPRGFPCSITLDQSILGFILVNREEGKCLSTTSVNRTEENAAEERLIPQTVLRTLRWYYKMVTEAIFPQTPTDDANSESSGLENQLTSQCLESYSCAKTYKFCAVQINEHQIYVLFRPTIPTYALRNVTHRTLQALTRGKHLRL